MSTTVPLVEVANNADRLRVRSPDRKVHAVNTVDRPKMSPQFFVDVEVVALVEQVQIHVRQQRFKIVRIVFGHRCIFLSVPNLVSLVLVA